RKARRPACVASGIACARRTPTSASIISTLSGRNTNSAPPSTAFATSLRHVVILAATSLRVVTWTQAARNEVAPAIASGLPLDIAAHADELSRNVPRGGRSQENRQLSDLGRVDPAAHG